MAEDLIMPFHIEWLPEEEQHYHGPKKHMKEMLFKHSVTEEKQFNQAEVINHVISTYPNYLDSIEKIKFYRIIDEASKAPLHFFLIWCNYSMEVREELYASRDKITATTGWYPVITGHRVFHHKRSSLDLIDKGLKKSMNKSAIVRLPGLGNLLEITNFSEGKGTSILLKTTNYDLILDAGMTEEELKFDQLSPQTRKWLFISHSHKDHTGGMDPFIKGKQYAIAINPVSLELFLNAIEDIHDLETYLPKDFFYRLAPMWYRSDYKFVDGSSIQTIPTYHFPGSIGYLFTFSNGETLFYSGDLNVTASYLGERFGHSNINHTSFDLGRKNVDYGLIEAAFVGRKIGTYNGNVIDLVQTIENSAIEGHNHLLFTPPNDYGFFLFLHLYDTLISKSTRKVDVRLFLDPRIIKQLAIIEWRMKRKQTGSLDDGLLDFLKHRTTLAESVRVFDFSYKIQSNLKQLSDRKIPGIFILDDQRADDPIYLSPSVFNLMQQSGLDVSRIGKAATKPMTSDLIGNCPITDFDGHFWLLHSTEKALSDYFLNGPQQYKQLYLFHNFKGRLEKFAKHLNQSGYRGKINSL
jgi:hypothetical protein